MMLLTGIFTIIFVIMYREISNLTLQKELLQLEVSCLKEDNVWETADD